VQILTKKKGDKCLSEYCTNHEHPKQ